MLSKYVNTRTSEIFRHQPLFIVRAWLSWYLFEYSKILEKEQYNILPGGNFFDPIVPIQQIPETNDLIGEAPFIVYSLDYTDRQTDDIWIKEEQIELDVYASNYFDIIAVANVLFDAVDRKDLTAQDINEFYYEKCAAAGEEPRIKFLTSTMFSSDEQLPAKQPMDRMSKPIFWEYQYTRCLDNRGRFAY